MANFKSKFQGNLLISVFYFLVYAGAGSLLAFYNLYLEDDLGFSGARIGIVNGIYQGMMLVAVIIWGVLADKRGIRFALTISLFVTVGMLLGLPYFQSFLWLVPYIFLFALFYHPNPPLIDTLAINHARYYHTHAFGKLRLWGSVGWGTATLLVGWLLTIYDLKIIFRASALGFFFLFILVATYVKTDPNRVKGNFISFKDFKLVFSNKKLAFFFMIIFLYGLSISPLNYFINLYFKDIGASNSLVGYAFTVQAFSEIPFFFYADALVRRYGSRNTMILTIMVTIIRMILYSMISDPLLAIPLGTLHGFTLAIFLVAVVDYVHKLVPAHWRATAQSLIWAFHFGAGVTIGNILIGYLKDTLSMQTIMFWMAMSGVLVLALFYLFFHFAKKEDIRNGVDTHDTQ